MSNCEWMSTNTLVINILEFPSWSRMKMLTVFWASVVLTLAFASLQASAQPGFLSIDCGATAPYIDSRNISWVPDTSYMTLGSIANVTLASSDLGLTELSTLRYFPDATRKRYCYLLPSKVGQTYMVRPRFYHGGYDNFPTLSFNINFEFYENSTFSFTPTNNDLYQEFIAVATATNMQLCVVRTSAADTPFISSIEMRLLDSGMYTKVQDGSGLAIQSRANYGAGQSVVRYPDDAYDRQWYAVTAPAGFQNLTSPYVVVNSGFAPDKPPPAVMNTAVALPYSNTTNHINLQFSLSFVIKSNSVFYLALYFAEIQNLTANDVRIMNISINSNVLASGVNVFSSAKNALYVPIEVSTNSTSLLATNNEVIISQAAGSSLGPSINAAELYYIAPSQAARTSADDISAIESIKTAFNLTTYTGDPCLPIPHEWLSCTSTSPPRVSSMLLSKYNLTGPIPSTLASLTNLTTLYLDKNALTGEIPDLSRLTTLKLLHLENNALTGSIPDWLTSLTSLQGLYLQNNQLSGNVPKGLLSNSALTLVVTPGNAGLCINTTCSASSKSNVGAIVGGVAGGILVVVIAIMLIYCLCWKKKTLPYGKHFHPHGDEEDASSRLSSNGTKYTLAQVYAATNNNARLLGRGGFGPVYYGKLPSGQEVAVKVSAKGSAQGTREFLNEVELLTRVHHKNLVSLVGYCQEGDSLILLYEYMPNGTVQEHLYGGPAKDTRKLYLDWKTRLNIALNAAQGLEYLHVGCSPAIFHRDVKSNNILLTKNWLAKVADFGLSKSTNSKENVTHVSTMVKGTIGYLDPDYFNTNQLTDKSDVYSFGVVLLELICGRAPFNPALPEDQRRLDQWVRPHLQAGNIRKIVDPELGGNYNVESMWKVADLAMTSVEPKSVHRPRMSVICQELRDALNLESSSGSISNFSNVSTDTDPAFEFPSQGLR